MPPRPLDPISLQHLVAVCEEGSMARAAARESVVPSALSKRIAALEAEVGVELLVRSRRGVTPTAAGDALLGRAREVLAGLARARHELEGFGTGVHGHVRVLASPSVLAEQLPEDIARFLGQQTALRVSIDEVGSSTIVRQLLQGSADLGVLWDAADLQGLRTQPYRHDHLCAAMSPGDPLASRSSMRFADTLDSVSIGVLAGGLMDTVLRRQAALLGRTLQHRIEVSTMDSACRIASAGLGVCILPRELAAPHAGAGRLALVPLDDDWAIRRFVIASRGGSEHPEAARLLAAHLSGLACTATAPRPGSATLSSPPNQDGRPATRR